MYVQHLLVHTMLKRLAPHVYMIMRSRVDVKMYVLTFEHTITVKFIYECVKP